MAKQLKWKTQQDLAIKKTPTVGRVEYLNHMTFQSNIRPLFTEIFGPIVGLKEEWELQGASTDELDFSAFRYRTEGRGQVPVNTGWAGDGDGDESGGDWLDRQHEILEETENHILYRDHMGRTLRLVKGFATIALPLDYPVKTWEDWQRVKHHYAYSESRFASGWEEAARRHREAGRVVAVSIPGGFDEPRQLMGEEALCLAYYEQPDLIADMLATIADTAFRVLDRVSSRVQVDMLTVHEDMAGKSGPLIGPVQIAEFIQPYYLKIWSMLADRGAMLFDQDSDGNMNPVIEAFLDCGVNCMHPMEPAAGMDMVQTRERYGNKLAMYGGIDKHVLRRSREEIADELEYKIPPMVAGGACVLALDHRIPNGTPLAHYRYYLEKAWEILEREEARLK